MIDFISVPVIAGFTSAAALTIASGQVLLLILLLSTTLLLLSSILYLALDNRSHFQWKSLLGVTIDPHHKSHTHAGIVDYYIDIFHNIASVRYQDAVLGLVCCAILLSLRVGGQPGRAVQIYKVFRAHIPEKAITFTFKTL